MIAKKWNSVQGGYRLQDSERQNFICDGGKELKRDFGDPKWKDQLISLIFPRDEA